MPKRKITPKINTYRIVARAVEEGVQYGVNRAIKYNGERQLHEVREVVIEHVEREVLTALAEVINYEIS